MSTGPPIARSENEFQASSIAKIFGRQRAPRFSLDAGGGLQAFSFHIEILVIGAGWAVEGAKAKNVGSPKLMLNLSKCVIPLPLACGLWPTAARGFQPEWYSLLCGPVVLA